MARLNTRIADVSEQIETADDDDGKLDKLKEILRAPMSPNEEAQENAQPVQQQPTPETEESSERPPKETSEPTQNVSSTSTTPSLTTDDTAASPTSPELPEKNRGGQKVRWSLNKSEILKDPDRAENAIQKSRLEGESKAARRRRVKREIEFVKTLPIARDDSAGPRERSLELL
ncbi:hypothetical protein HII31_06460 [Pseudocercospora fuligena]|uniref:Uncharacterized protein n=1 Tax=Pseudocercospora fuligena TaxID=685502 RepID=A0A8H6VL58_9PEZI|nr:hypothetical protein HII31_06460 [Pseudocercospora fuligena]